MLLRFFIKNIRFLFFKFYFGNLNINKNYKKYLFKNLLIDKKIFNLYKLSSSRVYTNTNDVAYIDKNNFIHSRTSIQLRGNKNSKISNNYTFKYGTPKFIKKINSNVFSLLCGASGNDNYYHWFFDVLPRYYLFKKAIDIKSKDFFVVPNIKHEFQRETLRLLKIKNIINAYKVNHVQAKNIYVSNLKFSANKFPPKWIIKEHKKYFLKKNKFINNKNKINIYISRKDSINHHREILNEKELLNILKKRNFKIVKLSKLSILQKINLFQKAKVVVGLYGAGLLNLIFSNKKTKVLEIKNTKSGDLYKYIIQNAGVNYKSIIFKGIKNNNTIRSFDADIYVNKNKFAKILNRIL